MWASGGMTRRRFACVAGAGLAAAGLEGVTRSDDRQTRPSEGKVEMPPGLPGWVKEAVARYRIELGTDPPRPLTLHPEPVLRWTNPLRNASDGASFVWLADGRPEVAACFYRYNAEGGQIEDHEFQSLSTTTLVATREGQVVWAPPQAGVTLAPVAGSPAPADSPTARLPQMRALAREFKASLDLSDNQTELRLLPQPLYRYEPKRAELVDGALFAFVLTTDPEVLLLLEARRPREGAPAAWQFGLARMSMVNLKAEHQGRPIWNVGWVNDVSAPNKPYLTIPAR
jgi:hypothetical protein